MPPSRDNEVYCGVLIHYRAKNNSWSLDVIQPNFENVWPISHYDWTRWPTITSANLELLFSSRCYQSINYVLPKERFERKLFPVPLCEKQKLLLQYAKTLPFFIAFSFLKTLLVSSKISLSPSWHREQTVEPAVEASIIFLRIPLRKLIRH